MLLQKYGIKSIVFIDFETTGLDPKKDHPTEVALKHIGWSTITGQPTEKYYNTMIKLPKGVEVSEFIQELTGLTTEKVNSEGADKEKVMYDLQGLISARDTLVVAQSANFDLGFLKEHFGIEPAHFICTKTIEFFTAPHLSTSLNDTHKRYVPTESFEQTHRAMDDVNMLFDIFFGQVETHGADALGFFKNKIAVMPERPLVFTPYNAIVLDYSIKYSTVKTNEILVKQRNEAEGLLSQAGSMLDDLHQGDSELMREIDSYFGE